MEKHGLCGKQNQEEKSGDTSHQSSSPSTEPENGSMVAAAQVTRRHRNPS
jgi:hypothetical protein